MANRLIRFISKTQARLGRVDTISERLLCQTAREIKSIVKAPKRLLSSLLIVLTIARPTFADPLTVLAEAVKLLANKTDAIKGIIEDSQRIQDDVKDLTEKGFVNSLVNSYKQIKLTQASIESISTSSLRSTLDFTNTKINMTSGTDLSEKDVLGITHKSGEYKPLRLRSRNFSDTNFSDAKVFSDELDKVVDEFDAMQVIRYQAQADDKVGTAILNGNVKEVDEAVDEQWQEFLNDEEGDNKFNDFIKNQR